MDGEDILATSVAFLPLPFRALLLVGLGIFCWASNLHLLHLLGIDVPAVLDPRPEKLPTSAPPSPWVNGGSELPPAIVPAVSTARKPRPSTHTLHEPVYRVFAIYAAWVSACYILFNRAVQGDMNKMDRARPIIVVATLGIAAALACPFNILQKRERNIFLVAFKRCLLVSSSKPVYFCDVIMADILTSFAKVLGDVWVSVFMLLPGGSLKMSALDISGWSEWVIPALISLPYVIRFRQCVAEYLASDFKNTRSLMNAVKYASSFPVIFLSAMQKIVVADVAAREGPEKALHSTWHGEHAIFRLWLLSVMVSSFYSFWWDVTNDWGLDLLRPSLGPAPTTPHPSSSSDNHRLPPNQPHPSPSKSRHQQHPFGLRTPLLYRFPAIYYLAIILNLVLRFTWSMRLSPHLHTFAELETGVFVVEACELLRRWLWVFFRVEWEVVKKGGLEGHVLEMKEPHSAGLLSVPSAH